ncbi:MAG TPA: aspartate aminotransferase family protein [Bryobacteraceae bacterium]|nr:aspartate aminotransferase family protein [Bryobacteraceae bacterium]
MQQATAKRSGLIGLREALRMDPREATGYEAEHLNPRISKLWEFIGLGEPQVRALGPFIWDRQGRRYSDFFGYAGSLGLGHNHPRLIAALGEVAEMPNLCEGPNILAGILAHNLSMAVPGALTRVYFGNSGTEAVDAAIKLARAATGRPGIIFCQGAFHGRSLGALSVTDRAEYRKPFEPLLPGAHSVPFGDLAELEQALAAKDTAAFLVEPLQGEGGMRLAPAGYLHAAQQLCANHGALLIFDEIQCGMGCTGKFVACQHEPVTPDCLLLGKAMGGGLMPLSALLTTDALWRKAHGDTPSTPFHTATYGGNVRACAVGIAALEALFEEGLIENAETSGAYLLSRLRDLQLRQPAISAVRGRGLMIGVEFSPAEINPGMAGMTAVPVGAQGDARQLFVGLLIRRLAREHGLITGITLHNPNVLRLQPPLNVGEELLDQCVESLDSALTHLSRFKEATLEALPDILSFLRSGSLADAYE